jgi:tRNA(Ile)-lysidine synthase
MREITTRFVRRLEGELAGLEPSAPSGAPLVVAFSGGLDSCVLLHGLRFGGAAGREIVAAHFDHRMRPGGARDAAWARGVCAAWGVAFHLGEAAAIPPSEDAARRARYDFLLNVRDEVDGAWLLTGHHADDQAETVLFRVLRGTGIAGLRGIPARRPPAIARPLLGLWRDELLAYARAVGLRWREDPTNEHLGYARNVIRHQVLPTIEAQLSPHARRALVRLAELADRDEAAWAELMPRLLEETGYRDGSLDAEAVARLGPGLRARVLRQVATLGGRTLDERATRRAVRFAELGRSGTRIELGGGLELQRELDRLVLAQASLGGDDRPLAIPDPGPGEGVARLGGRAVRVHWWPGLADRPLGAEPSESGTVRTSLTTAGVEFPLEVRGRRHGDRLADRRGGGRVKRLLQDARIPSRRRDRIPIVSDASGQVLWIAGVAGVDAPGDDAAESMTITIGR